MNVKCNKIDLIRLQKYYKLVAEDNAIMYNIRFTIC